MIAGIVPNVNLDYGLTSSRRATEPGIPQNSRGNRLRSFSGG